MQKFDHTAPTFSSARLTLGRLQELVLSSDGLQWLEALHQFKVGQTHSVSNNMLDEFLTLGICRHTSDGITLTPFGNKCADSAREYLFWIGRDRKFHGENELEALKLENFRGKDLLEIGPGWGCNLVRLSSVARQAIGLEIEPVYVEFSRLLPKRERLTPPCMVLGRGESAPFASDSFDWVLLWSALYYMNINETLKECRRIMRMNGCLLISMPLLTQVLASGINGAFRHRKFRTLLRTVLVVLDTAWYQTSHKRLRKSVNESSTARPVYITKKHLIARAARAGLKLRSDMTVQLSDRFLVVFQKR